MNTMNRRASAALVPLVAATIALSGCGAKTPSSAGGAPTATTAPGSSSATSAGASAGPGGCPTTNTRSFAKTRFVADVGLAAGTFHHWIYAPYKAGSFNKGTKGRVTALIKAGAVALIDAKLIDNAYQNVEASPALCKALIAPLGDLKTELTTLKGHIATGDTTALGSVDSLVQRVESAAASNGASIIENADLGSAQAATHS